MKLPRDIRGEDLAGLLHRFGYQVIRQTGSHIRLGSSFKGSNHRVSIPAHKSLSVGTLSAILTEVASYLKMTRANLAEQLFGK